MICIICSGSNIVSCVSCPTVLAYLHASRYYEGNEKINQSDSGKYMLHCNIHYCNLVFVYCTLIYWKSNDKSAIVIKTRTCC
jgi:hypothetical protein